MLLMRSSVQSCVPPACLPFGFYLTARVPSFQGTKWVMVLEWKFSTNMCTFHLFVHFQWIPSHVDIYGNKTADILAKKGAGEPLGTPDLLGAVFKGKKRN